MVALHSGHLTNCRSEQGMVGAVQGTTEVFFRCHSLPEMTVACFVYTPHQYWERNGRKVEEMLLS